ncbi:response regulator [Sphingomonas sp. LB-2]|uniref:response regulator n=1 Tax=Sphingomonas caeni TaxID=2984949 RepID=UPI0022312E38|nr:response regulator [Sphingomonas caeni]MCW3849627.1 response regulator [Sphingomonas caeni]
MRPILLLVEDDDAVRRSLQLLLSGSGYRVRSFASSAAALADPIAIEAKYLVADFMLPESDGVELLRGLRARGWSGGAVLVTAFPSDELRQAAEAVGYAAVMEKPLRQEALLGALGRAAAA